MPHPRYDIEILQGATFRKSFTWQDAAGNPVSVAGYNARMQVRDKPGGEVWIDVRSGVPGQIEIEPNGAVGVIAVRIGADLTAAMPKSGVYDLELTLATDPTEVVRLVGGRAMLSAQVTE